MTVLDALSAVRRVGTVEKYAGKLRLRLPAAAAPELQAAIDTLRNGKAEALALLSQDGVAEPVHACALLNRLGVRIIALEDGAAIGVWSDLDGLELRAALATVGIEHMAVLYLDGSGVPMRYKLRKVAGEAVPLSVLKAMEQADSEPWAVRDAMLRKMR